jgi:hypothetical protein
MSLFERPAPQADGPRPRRSLRLLGALVAAFGMGVGSPSSLGSPRTPSSDEEVSGTIEFEDLGLTIRLPTLERLAATEVDGNQVRGDWRGRLGSSHVRIVLRVFPASFRLGCPEEVTDLIELNLDKRASEDGPDFRGGTPTLLEGPFGYAPYASLARFEILDKATGEPASRLDTLGGILERGGYSVEVESVPPISDTQLSSTLVDFLENGIAYSGPVWDVRWSNEAAEERWRKDTPPDLHKKLKPPIRTDHYLILTNSSGGRLFARKMEENYEKIREAYPFPDMEGRRLLPVFLFRTPDEYYDFCMRVAQWPREQAKRSKGHAWKDYYATWYESPNDPTHIHEATHQIFANRLRLRGGGSWFQEGVAEYMGTKRNDRNNIARIVKNREQTPLAEFVKIRSLLHSGTDQRVKGGSESRDHYTQAALLIEFLKESDWGGEGFQDFLHAMGQVRRGDEKEIAGVFQSVYGATLEEVDEQFVEYCRKRR